MKIQVKSGVRKLTPREYWRLMGFDDSDFDKANEISSDTQLYKQAGNAVSPLAIAGISKHIFAKNEKGESIWR